jgi:hypothetical protein
LAKKIIIPKKSPVDAYNKLQDIEKKWNLGQITTNEYLRAKSALRKNKG